MDLQAILTASASLAKPAEYQLVGGATLYIRRFTCVNQDEFLEACKAKTERKEVVTKAWVIAFGLCDERNAPLYPNPEDGEPVLKALLVEDQLALEELIMAKLGLPLEKTKKA